MIDIKAFIQQGYSALEGYVAGVGNFLDQLDTPGGLKKTSLRSKPIDSYVRNMLAVGVLNRIMRQAFLKTERRIIVLPDCLKNCGDWECCKEDDGNASTCTQCTPDCIVFETMERFGNSHTAIVLEPEDMDAYFAEVREQFGTVGIAGVACALTMLSGFSRTIKYKHPTQGVFLNYSSCAHHWADPAYNTSYSLRRMAWVLNKNGSSDGDDIHNRGETYSLEKRPGSPDDFYQRLDKLAVDFEKTYLSHFVTECPDADIYDICSQVQQAMVPDLITRESA